MCQPIIRQCRRAGCAGRLSVRRSLTYDWGRHRWAWGYSVESSEYLTDELGQEYITNSKPLETKEQGHKRAITIVNGLEIDKLARSGRERQSQEVKQPP